MFFQIHNLYRYIVAKQGADMVDAWLMGHLCRPLKAGLDELSAVDP